MAHDKKKLMPLLRHAYGLDATMKEIAAYAGIGYQTLYNWLEENPELKKELDALRHNPMLKARTTLVNGLDEWDHSFKYAERKCKSEFAQRSEMTGADGKDLPIPILCDVSLDDSDKADNGDEGQDKGGTGGNVGE